MQQIGSEEIQVRFWMDGKCDPLRYEQEIKICTCWLIVNAQTETVQENETHKILWDFKMQTVTKSRPED